MTLPAILAAAVPPSGAGPITLSPIELYLQADIVVDMDDENVNSAAEAVLNAIRKVESD